MPRAVVRWFYSIFCKLMGGASNQIWRIREGFPEEMRLEEISRSWSHEEMERIMSQVERPPERFSLCDRKANRNCLVRRVWEDERRGWRGKQGARLLSVLEFMWRNFVFRAKWSFTMFNGGLGGRCCGVIGRSLIFERSFWDHCGDWFGGDQSGGVRKLLE